MNKPNFYTEGSNMLKLPFFEKELFDDYAQGMKAFNRVVQYTIRDSQNEYENHDSIEVFDGDGIMVERAYLCTV